MSDFKLLQSINEARDPNVTYSTKEVKGKLDRVIADLAGKQSGEWTRISNQYIELDDSIKQLTLKRDELNTKLKEKATELFEAEDEVLTRVVETIQLTLTLSKKSVKPSVEVVDAEAVVKALSSANLPEKLKLMVDELIAANTTMSKEKVTPEKLSIKRVDEASIVGTIKGIIRTIRKSISFVKSMLGGFDKDLLKIKKQIENL